MGTPRLPRLPECRASSTGFLLRWVVPESPPVNSRRLKLSIRLTFDFRPPVSLKMPSIVRQLAKSRWLSRCRFVIKVRVHSLLAVDIREQEISNARKPIRFIRIFIAIDSVRLLLANARRR